MEREYLEGGKKGGLKGDGGNIGREQCNRKERKEGREERRKERSLGKWKGGGNFWEEKDKWRQKRGRREVICGGKNALARGEKDGEKEGREVWKRIKGSE